MAANDLESPTNLSFEEALARLQNVVHDLEGGQLGLSESLQRYEEGISYLTKCHQMLANAERKIEVLSGIDAEGNPVSRRFDEESMSLEDKARSRSRRRSATPESADSSASGEADIDGAGTLF